MLLRNIKRHVEPGGGLLLNWAGACVVDLAKKEAMPSFYNSAKGEASEKADQEDWGVFKRFPAAQAAHEPCCRNCSEISERPGHSKICGERGHKNHCTLLSRVFPHRQRLGRLASTSTSKRLTRSAWVLKRAALRMHSETLV